jgi:hypothetical protein
VLDAAGYRHRVLGARVMLAGKGIVAAALEKVEDLV